MIDDLPLIERKTSKHTIAGISFDSRLPYDLAIGASDEREIFLRYGLSQEQAALLKEHELFKMSVAAASQELKESGMTFRLKAKVMAEDLLEEAYMIATDPLSPTAERVKLIQWAAKMADLEPAPKDKAQAVGIGGGGFNLQIVLQQGGGAQGQVIDVSTPAPGGDVIKLLEGSDGD